MGTTPDYGLLDRAGAAASIFFPRPDHSGLPPGATDLAFEVEQGVSLGARFYAFDPAFATVLYFHGNGEVAGDHDDVAPMYGQVGANLLVVDFRGYGRSGGRPAFASLVADGPAAARWFHRLLDEQGFSAMRLVMGRSLGAHPALEIASNASDGFAGLIVESGAGNIRRLASRVGGGDSAEVAELAAAHEAKVASITLPSLFIHGEQDELIPIESAVETFASIGTERKKFVALQGVGHNDLLWRRSEEYFAAIEAFLVELP